MCCRSKLLLRKVNQGSMLVSYYLLPKTLLSAFSNSLSLFILFLPSCFFAALGPSLFLSINPGIQYATFDQIKGFLTKERKNNTLTAFEAFLLGAFSKCIATIVTYPAIRGKVVCQSGKSS